MPLMTVTDSANNIINLVGSVEGVMTAFPATNSDGSANQPAQDAAISSMVASLVTSGLFQLPNGATLAQIQVFAPLLVKTISGYKTSTRRTELSNTIMPSPPTIPASNL